MLRPTPVSNDTFFRPPPRTSGSLYPHYLAELCEKTEDYEPRRYLFLCVVHASLASDTVSAVRRLLRGDQKARFVEVTKEYRERVGSMWAQYPPWVQGRLRGLFASLRVG